jgi:hypothetical protein
VRKIDLHEDAVDQGEPQCHEDIEAAEDYAIDALLEDDGQHDRCLKPPGGPSIAAISTGWAYAR